MRLPISFARVGAGPPVLLLHGLGGDHRQAMDLLPGDLGRTRLAPDLPGHGDTDLQPGEPVSFAAFAAHVAARLDAQGLAAVPVAGVSMGAGVATALAASRPDLVSRLILIRPAWLDVAPPPNLAAFPHVAHLLTTLGPDAGAEAFRATAVFGELSAAAPAVAQSLLGQFTRPLAVARARVLAEMPANLPLPHFPEPPLPGSRHRAELPARGRQRNAEPLPWGGQRNAEPPSSAGRHGADPRAVESAYAALDVETLVVAAPQDPVHPEGLARTLSGWIRGSRFALAPRKVPDRDDHPEAVRAAVAGELAGHA